MPQCEWDAIDEEMAAQAAAADSHRRQTAAPVAKGKRTAGARMGYRRTVAFTERNVDRIVPNRADRRGAA